MINYRVQEIEAMVKKLKNIGVTIINEISTYPYGKFVHILDPEGNIIELWEPKEDFIDTLKVPINKKQAISRILSCPIINLGDTLLHRSIRLPSNLDALS